MPTQLGIFAKHWHPGKVKTRLAASIGNGAAALLHRLFVQTLLNRFQDFADRHVLCFTPAESMDFFRQLDLSSWTLEPQAAGDLGTRMQYYFSSALSAAVRPLTILIGSDSPDLPREYVQQAFERLRDFPVVLGPTSDGGYYLLGLSQSVPAIFDGISWSTPDVWPQTTARLRAAQIPFYVLPQWYDVDDEQGLNSLIRTVSQPETRDSHLPNLKHAIQDILRQPSTLNLEP